MAAPAPAAPAKKQLYRRFAEIGRVVLIQYGKEAGKLATIIDILDHNRALIDGPHNLTGVKRQVINFKWLALTDLKLSGKVEVDGKTKKVAVARNARQKTLTAVWNALGIQAKWDASAWGKKLAAKKAAAASTDFSRFTAKVAKQQAARAVRAVLAKKA